MQLDRHEPEHPDLHPLLHPLHPEHPLPHPLHPEQDVLQLPPHEPEHPLHPLPHPLHPLQLLHPWQVPLQLEHPIAQPEQPLFWLEPHPYPQDELHPVPQDPEQDVHDEHELLHPEHPEHPEHDEQLVAQDVEHPEHPLHPEHDVAHAEWHMPEHAARQLDAPAVGDSPSSLPTNATASARPRTVQSFLFSDSELSDPKSLTRSSASNTGDASDLDAALPADASVAGGAWPDRSPLWLLLAISALTRLFSSLKDAADSASPAI